MTCKSNAWSCFIVLQIKIVANPSRHLQLLGGTIRDRLSNLHVKHSEITCITFSTQLVNNFFEGSMNSLVSFLVKEKELSKEELNTLLEKLDQADKKDKK